MTEIPIFLSSGIQGNSLVIRDSLSFVSGRVSRGDKCYYKGVGSIYRGHSSLTPVYKVLGRHPVFYYGYSVVNPEIEGKFGIFQQKFQPYFSDFCGSCGPKELALVGNSKYNISSVKVLDVIKYDNDNDQYYFKLDYQCSRQKYLETGSPGKLLSLINNMLDLNFNFPWDKGSINDVSACGRVSDVADLFVSDSLQHKLGTVYSILYSLGNMDKSKYNAFNLFSGLKHNDTSSYVMNSLVLLDRFGINIDEIVNSDDVYEVYRNVVNNWLLTGRNCAYVEDASSGDKVRLMFNRLRI